MENNILYIYSIHDIKAESYVQPFLAPNDALALRMLQNACNDANTDFFKFAEDYSLWRVGKFDQNSGTIEAEKPNCLAKAFDLVQREGN